MDFLQFSDELLARLQGESDSDQLALPIAQVKALRQALLESGQALGGRRQAHQGSVQSLEEAQGELERLESEYRSCFQRLGELQKALERQRALIAESLEGRQETLKSSLQGQFQFGARQQDFLLHLFGLLQLERRALQLKKDSDRVAPECPEELRQALFKHGFEVELEPKVAGVIEDFHRGRELPGVECQWAYDSVVPRGELIQVLRLALVDRRTGFRLALCPLELQLSRGPEDALLAALTAFDSGDLSESEERIWSELVSQFRDQFEVGKGLTGALILKAARFVDRCLGGSEGDRSGPFQGVLEALEEKGLEFWPRSRRRLTEGDYRRLLELGLSKSALVGVPCEEAALGTILELDERAIVREGELLSSLTALRFSLGAAKPWREALKAAMGEASGLGARLLETIDSVLDPFYRGTEVEAWRSLLEGCSDGGGDVAFLESYFSGLSIEFVPGTEPCIDRYPLKVRESVAPFYSSIGDVEEGFEGEIRSVARRGLLRGGEWLQEPDFAVVRTGALEVLAALDAVAALSPGLDLASAREKALELSEDEDPRRLFDVLVRLLNERLKESQGLLSWSRLKAVEEAFSALKPSLILKPAGLSAGQALEDGEGLDRSYAYSSTEAEGTVISVLSFSHSQSLQRASVLLSKGLGPPMIQELRKLCQRIGVLDGVPRSFERELLVMIERDLCSEDKSRVGRAFVAIWKRIRDVTVALDGGESRRGVSAAMSDFTLSSAAHAFFSEHELAPYSPPAGFPIGHEAVSGTIEITGSVPSGSRVVIKDIVFPGLSQGTVTLVTAVVSARQG